MGTGYLFEGEVFSNEFEVGLVGVTGEDELGFVISGKDKEPEACEKTVQDDFFAFGDDGGRRFLGILLPPEQT